MNEINYYKLHYELWDRIAFDCLNIRNASSIKQNLIKLKCVERMCLKYHIDLPESGCFLCEKASKISHSVHGTYTCKFCECNKLFKNVHGACLGLLYDTWATAKTKNVIVNLSIIIRNLVVDAGLYDPEGENYDD